MQNLPKEDQKKDEKSEVLPFVPKRRWVPIIFAREVSGVFKVTTALFLLVALLATLKLASESADLRSRAAKGPLAPVFCIGRAMCPDGHCEGDSWADCDECPEGRAKIVTEVRCGIYKETECIHETKKCD